MFPIRLMVAAVGLLFAIALTPLVFKAPDAARTQISNIEPSRRTGTRSNERLTVSVIDRDDYKFNAVPSPQQKSTGGESEPVPDQKEAVTGSITSTAPLTAIMQATAAPAKIDQSLAIEFPVAAAQANETRLRVKHLRHSYRVTKVTANQYQNVSQPAFTSQQTKSAANKKYYYEKPVELPAPNFTNSAY